MNGANIGTFDTSVPADTESLGLTDDRIRSVKTSFQQALNDEHNFPAAGGSVVGYHLFGSARPYFGTQSRVSSSGTDGRLMMTSDTSRLFAAGSGGTVFYGGSQVLSVGTDADTAGGRHHWVEEFGLVYTSSNSTQITIPNSGFSGMPRTFLQIMDESVAVPSGNHPLLVVQNPTATTFIVAGFDQATGAFSSVRTFFWRSLGTRAL